MNLRKQLSSYIALNNYVEAIRENTSSIVLTDAITNGLTDLQLKGSEVKNKPEVFLDSVVAKGGTEQRNLPAEYTQLEYITFPSGAYIKTGIVPKTFDYEVGFKGAFSILSDGPNCAWGYMGASLIPRWICATYGSRYLLNANTTIGFGNADANTHTFVGRVYEKNGDYCWSSELDGVIQQNDQTLGDSSAWEANTLEIYVGARNNSSTAGNYGLITTNHWWCKKADVMIADYIPAKRNSDNVLGMYDLISNTFFTNQGSGTFTAGPEVVPTPDTPMDIVSNNGVLKLSPNGQIYTDGTVETIKDSLNNTATAEMLLKVGDYQDEQEILSGTVTRNVGVKVLDGTEDWTKGQSFYCNTLTGVAQTDHSCYCTHYQGVMNTSAVVTDSNTCRVGYHIGSDIAWDRLYIYADRSLYATAQDFANYLADQYAAGTPVIVIYPLNASTTETVSSQKLFKNPVTVTEASIDNLEVTTTEAEHTVPTPDYPLDIVCNNGVLKVGSDNSVIVEGTPETVTITGKNLLDINKTSGTGYLNTSGELVPFDNYYCSDYIEIKPSTVYTYTETMKSVDKNNFIRFCFYDSNKTFIPPRQGDTPTTEAKTYTYKITSPVNAKYIRISSHYDFVKGQLEEGIRPTKYEEYYQASFAPEDLLKLGDYQDVQDVINGIKSKKIGIKVLDGTESWTRYGTGKFAMPLIGSKKQDNQQAPICSHFIGVSDNNVPVKDGYVSVFNASIAPTSGGLGINYQATPELTQFKQWLADQYAAGTPVIVVYPLANTVEETVESRDVFITSGTNTIERSSEYVSSDGITVKYKKLR